MDPPSRTQPPRAQDLGAAAFKDPARDSVSLTPGTRVGPYEIVGLVGAGGMGQVYRARDSRLRRDVAIKILPPAFAAGAEHLARFKREAQVLASLNHPHIAAIYGVEERPPEAAGGDYALALVLELVEGPTLADRIARGPIPVDEALPIARQIAEALEAAHERGIVHRDLKPANIKLRPDGTVKVLDFGLAKAMEEGAGEAHASSQSPTAMVDGTREGVILGTASFMSPEQARGQSVDKRTDVWAFGCVLYEMLTGRRAFGGDNVSDILARVIEREPDFGALPPTTPATIRTALRRCLEKDRRRRLPDIGVVRLDIDDAAASHAAPLAATSIGPPSIPSVALSTSASSSAAAPSPVTSARARIAWPLAALAIVIGVAVGVIVAGWWYVARIAVGIRRPWPRARARDADLGRASRDGAARARRARTARRLRQPGAGDLAGRPPPRVHRGVTDRDPGLPARSRRRELVGRAGHRGRRSTPSSPRTETRWGSSPTTASRRSRSMAPPPSRSARPTRR